MASKISDLHDFVSIQSSDGSFRTAREQPRQNKENLKQDAKETQVECDYDDRMDDDAASTTSTIVYRHVPFEILRERVIQLTQDHWPNLQRDSIEVERLKGGNYNRVVGITIKDSEQAMVEPRSFLSRLFQKFWWAFNKFVIRFGRTRALPVPDVGQYILRVPRTSSAWIEHEVAMLRYVRANSTIPAPQTFFYDTTEDNALSEQYTILNRVEGVQLVLIWSDLTHDQKVSIAKQLGHVILEMLSKPVAAAGWLDPSTPLKWEDGTKILDFPVPALYDQQGLPLRAPETPAKQQSILNLLCSLSSQWKAIRKPETRYWDDFADMAHELDRKGFFADNQFYLCHGDFKAKNILAKRSENGEISITTVLDWDLSVFGPRYMASKPPVWLWLENEDGGDSFDDSPEAGQEPTDPRSQEVKKVFEETVGAEYLDYAYKVEYCLARKLTDFCMYGLGSHRRESVADEMLCQWKQINEEKSKYVWVEKD